MIFVMFFILILASCQIRTIGIGSWIKKIDAEEASRLMLNFAAKMKREQRLDLEDSRLVYNDYIKKWYIEFSSQRLVTMCEARLLLVTVVEEFLYRINNHSLLSFEVEQFPFTASNLDIKINFESFHGLYVDPLYIGQIWLKCGCAYYYAFDRKVQDIDWSHDRWEPYFKSRELALLKQEADIPFTEPLPISALAYERYQADPLVPPAVFAPVASPIITIPQEPVGSIMPAPGSSSIIFPRSSLPSGITPVPIVLPDSGRLTTPVITTTSTMAPPTVTTPTVTIPTVTIPTVTTQTVTTPIIQSPTVQPIYAPPISSTQTVIAPSSTIPIVTPEPYVAPIPNIVQPSFTPDNIQIGN
jgi:hypothetical protein